MLKDQYGVSVSTPKGNVLIESTEQWNEIERMAKYLAVFDRNRVGETNKVKISAFFTNSPEDARGGIRSSNNPMAL